MSLTDRANARRHARQRQGRRGGRPQRPAHLPRGRRAFGRCARRQADACAQRAVQRAHPFSRRRRRGYGARRPCLAVPARGRRRHGLCLDPGAPAAHRVARLPHGRCGCRGRARRRRHHRRARVHASDRQAHPQARAEHPHHRLRVAERMGVAPRAGAEDARLRRSRHGAAAVRAGRAPAPGRPADDVRRPSAHRKARLAARSRSRAAGRAPAARSRPPDARRAARQPHQRGHAPDAAVRRGAGAAARPPHPPAGHHSGGAACAPPGGTAHAVVDGETAPRRRRGGQVSPPSGWRTPRSRVPAR